MAPALSASQLVKRYGDLVAVAGVDLRLERGGCLGLLGPNGAGKTTTIEMLVGLKRADGGEIDVLGRSWARDAHEIRELIGVQLQETKLEDKLTVAESIALFASFYQRRRPIDDVLDEVGLQEKRNARYETLSGGQKQRLALACALVNKPELLFLDEPTTGLDPQARRRVWEVVEQFRAGGGSVILTTHYMEEAERLSTQVVIVDQGRVIEEGAPREVVARLGAEAIIELRVPSESGQAERLDDTSLGAIPGVRGVRREPDGLVLTTASVQGSMASLLSLAEARGVTIEDLHTHRPTLEDVFVSLTGKQLRDG
jgi:ABC-2 type transport system ATP-binding protein